MKKYSLSIAVACLTLTTLFVSGCKKEDKDAISDSTVNKGIQIIVGNDGKEYEVVDLGLSTGTLWAKCNMGATSPEQTGSLYAWGEIETKSSYQWNNYYWSDGDDLSLFKYCTDPTYGTVDGISILEQADEAPSSIMGPRWRIPSDQDFRDLLTTRNCTAKWCKLNGVGGFLFTSVRKGYEGNAIFIPLAGMNDHGTFRFEGQYGWYWCNNLFYDGEHQKSITKEASVLYLQHTDVDNHIIKSRPRCVGLPIRPIYIPE